MASMRLWAPRWKDQRVRFTTRSDSVCAATVLVHLKTSGAGPSAIARVVALDIAASSYRPDVGGPVPGIANVIPDWLGRIAERGESDSPAPAFLRHARRVHLPTRNGTYDQAIPDNARQPAS